MKKHFLALDGLRGVAAFSVMTLHFNGTFSETNLLPHAYLAVDFFFVLSGFVIAYSYDQRIAEGLSFKTFMGMRLRRLYPMIVAGVTIGALYLALRNHIEPNKAKSAAYLLVDFIFGLLLLPPSLVLVQAKFYELDGPSWSLFFELLSNAVYAFLGRRLSAKLLGSVIIASGICLCAQAYFVPWRIARDIFLMPTGAAAMVGLARVGFSFFAGVAIFRLRNRLPNIPQFRLGSLGFSAACLFLVYTFAAPETWGNGYDLLATLVVYPLLVTVAADFQPTGWVAKMAQTSGWISYPFYIVHLPVAVAAAGMLKVLGIFDALPQPWLGIVLAAVVVATASALGKFYDEPIRKFLNRSRVRPSSTLRSSPKTPN